jgi:tetratricopeptide (TPR) repeat protein
LSKAGATVDLKLLRVASLLESDPPAAAREAAEILREHPGHPAATLLLGTARRTLRDPQAASNFAELAAAQPDCAPVQLELGRTLAAQGHSEQALAALTRAVQLQPDLAEGWAELASLHAARGDTRACDGAYASFTRLAPPERHLAEAAAALANHRLARADALLRERLARAPEDVGAMRMLAEVAGEREDYVEAERLLGECLRLAPGYARARYALARILHSQQKAAPMLPLLERLLMLEPDNFQYRTLQASAYNLLGQNERALQLHWHMLREFPASEQLWMYYGHSLRIAGRVSEAIEAYRKSLALKPQFGEAWFSLANLKTVRFDAADIAAMHAQLAREELSENDRLQFEFALGKALEDAGDFEASFLHYARGNALRRAQVLYDADASSRFAQRTCRLYTREFLAAREGSGTAAPDPIFIVGLPRSGSTLIEQILASHSQIEGTRELPDVPGFALELGARESPGKPPAYPQSVARLSRLELTALGERYLEQTRPHRRLGRPRFIDKMPANFCHVGLIHLMLPNSKIIDARRSALACCFANFKQHFQSGVWFTYSLEDLGHYYRDYVALTAHFDRVLPGRVHCIRYEDLVADLEGEVRRLLAYCGLPFEEQCLRFHETRRPVQTVSSEQVRQPLYADSVDQWRKFEPWLGPLKEALGDLAGVEPGERAP